MTSDRRISVLVLGLACWWIGGCPPPAALRPFDPIPMRDAVGIVTENAARIRHTVQAVGSVDGRGPREDGKIRSYHVDGTLFFLAPRFLRFNLKKLGTQQLLVGSNDRGYWVVQRDRVEPFCGSYDAPEDWPADVPFRPVDMIDALGLTPIDDDDSVLVQRIVEDHQQVLLLGTAASGQRYIRREYWLDRYGRRLIRRVVFRGPDGSVRMDSVLGDYRELSAGGPWLPYEISVSWPDRRASMEFQVRRWRFVDQVRSDSRQFAMPSSCE